MSASQLSLLDNIRFSNGSEGLKNYYHCLLQNNREVSLEMINDHKLQFVTLYLLRHELSKANVAEAINPLYRKSLEIVAELTGKKTAKTEKTIRSGQEDTASALRWMIRTGYFYNDTDKDYDQLMELSSLMLTRSFRDTAVLPEIAEMIFARQRGGKLIHELVWAFFEARSPESLLLIARRLYSPDSSEISLSKRLLCFVPVIRKWPDISGIALYSGVLSWLQNNRAYLYYTGESLHLSSSPIYYAVSWAAKYLCRPVSVDTGEPLIALNELENALSSRFGELPERLQQQLADFSYMLYRKNIYQWNTWIRFPIDVQTSLATQIMGGLI